MGFIYRMLNTKTGMSYIGQTINFKRRKAQHSRIHNDGSRKIYEAKKEYGYSAFEFSILKKCKNKEMDFFEAFYIEKHDSINNGYNILPGGSKSKRSEETRSRIAKANTGKVLSQEIKDKISKSQSGKPCPKHVRKLFSRPIKAYNVFTGKEFVAPGIKPIADKIGVCHKSVYDVLNGLRPAINGYAFEYLEKLTKPNKLS